VRLVLQHPEYVTSPIEQRANPQEQYHTMSPNDDDHHHHQQQQQQQHQYHHH